MLSGVKSVTNVTENVKKVTQLKVLLLLFMLGLIYGAFIIGLNQNQDINSIPNFTQQFINKRLEQSIVYTFLGSFASSIILVFSSFLLGFFAIGQPGIVFIPLFHGLGLGLSTAYLYQHDGFKGLLFTLVLIIPSQLIFTFALLLSSRESLRLSNKIFRLILPEKYGQIINNDLKLYVIRFLVIGLIVLVSSIIDTVCTFLFAGFFN